MTLAVKHQFWIKYFCIASVVALVISVGSNAMKPTVIIDTNDIIAQVQSSRDYDKNMQLGYNAVRQRNYHVALTYFQQALLARRNDRYATVALKNIESYIVRDQEPGAKRRFNLIYIPAFGQPMRLVPAGTRGAFKQHTSDTALGGARENSEQWNQDGSSSVQTFMRRNPIPSVAARQSQACQQGNRLSTALIPFKNESLITTATHPSFFFYIPQTSVAALFVVQDENNQTIYKRNFTTPSQPGIINLSVPASTVPEQKIGKIYYWSLSVACAHTNPSQYFVVQGLIQRIDLEPELKKKLATADLRQRAAIYAISGLFPDSLTILAQLRRENSTSPDLKTDWEDLLRTAGLEEITQASLVDCCP